MRPFLTAFVTAAVLSGFAAPAHAYPKSIVQVPVAEIWEPGQYSLKIVQDVDYPNSDRSLRTWLQSGFGITDHMEAGLDYNTIGIGEYHVEGNAKYQFVAPQPGRWGIAAGAYNISPHFKTFSYGVATGVYGPAHVTFGVGGEDKARFLTGLTVKIDKSFTALGEYLSGSDGSSAYGITYNINDKTRSQVYYQSFRNSPHDRIQVDLIYTARFHG